MPRREAPRQFLTISQKVKIGGLNALCVEHILAWLDQLRQAFDEHEP